MTQDAWKVVVVVGGGRWSGKLDEATSTLVRSMVGSPDSGVSGLCS